MAQTTIQRNDAVRFGSAILYIGSSFSSLVNIGAIRELAFNHKGETLEVPFDNTASLKFFKNGQKGSFTFQLGEIDLTILSQLEQGLTSLSTTAATPVAGATQTLTNGSWAVNTAYEIENQNGSGAVPTITSVVGSVDGALVANDDYDMVQMPNGKWAIVLQDLASSTTTTTVAQNIVITYGYTPNASKTLVFNDFGQKTTFVARIENTNNEGNVLRIDIEDVTNLTPLSMPFVADDGDDVSVIEMELEGSIVEIVDEQSTT
jgi:hypothetical protein